MLRFRLAAYPLVGINAMLGVGLFLPMITVLEARGSLSPFEIGVLAGAFPVMEGIAGLQYPRLLKRVPARLLMAGGQVLCAASCLALLAADSFAILLLGRVLGGCGGASVSVAQLLIGKSSTGAERVRQLGGLGAAQAFGFMAGLALMGLTIAVVGARQGVLLAVVLGACSGLAAALLVARMPSPVVAAPTVAVDVHAALPFGDLAFYALNTFIYISLAVQMSIWAGRQPELGPTGTSVTFVVLAVLSMALQAKLAGWAVGRYGHRSTIAAGFLVTGMGAGLFAGGVGITFGIVGLAMARAGYALIVPATLACILGDTTARASEFRAGWAMFAASLGSGFGPVIIGAIHSRFSLAAATATLGVVAVAAAAAAMALVRSEHGTSRA